MQRVALLLLVTVGCASSTPASPFFGDDKYLRFGVDPYAEADAVIDGQKSRGHPLSQRIVGQNFIALGFMDKGGRSSAVRILTVRGIAVALDDREASALEPGVSYALLAAPIEGTQDADRDGFEEVFVEQRRPDKECLQLYRVRDVGMVDPVLVDTQVLGQPYCPRSAADLDGDGIVELVGDVSLAAFGGLAVEQLMIPLWSEQHRFVARAQTAAQRAWVTREHARREIELQQARARLDYDAAFARAVEIAAFAYLEGTDGKAQVAAFDRALRGLVLTPQQSAANLRARTRIYEAWNGTTEGAPSEKQQSVHVSTVAPAPQLEPDEIVITPDGTAPRHANAAPAATRAPKVETPVPAPKVATAAAASKPATQAAAPKPATQAAAPDAIEAHREAAREAGNAAFAERALATTARQSAQNERNEAQAARLRAAKAPDSASAAEERRQAAEHVAAAQRYAAEAAEHAAQAAQYSAQRQEHRSAASPAPPPSAAQ